MIKFTTEPEKLNLHFFAVPPKSNGPFQKALDLFDYKCGNYNWNTPEPKILRNILITPINQGKRSRFLPYIRKMKRQGIVEKVIFDSGGFSLMTGTLAQKGIHSVEDLVWRDKILYRDNVDFVDGFMMLDDPPTLNDCSDMIEKKIQGTIETTLNFFDQMNNEVRAKCIPIFHCPRDKYVPMMKEAYEPVIKESGYVAFSASSMTAINASRKLADGSSLILKGLVDDLKEVHCLGIVSPQAAFLLSLMGVRSYDGTSATLAAGNGEVYLPFHSSIPMTDKDPKSYRTPSQQKWDIMKIESGHHCPFCESVNEMVKNRDYRWLHNLVVCDQLPYFYKGDQLKKFESFQKTKKYINIICNSLSKKEQMQLF